MKTKFILICCGIWLTTLICLSATLIYLMTAKNIATISLFLLFLLNFLLISACISTITIGILALWRKFHSQKKSKN